MKTIQLFTTSEDRHEFKVTLRKNGPDFCLLWLIKIWSDCRGGGFLRIGRLCPNFGARGEDALLAILVHFEGRQKYIL